MFCGPVMDYASTWTNRVPGGVYGIAITALSLGIALFGHLEGMSSAEAGYFCIVTGTTIGYGDIGPKTDMGKIATAVYAILVVNVVSALLEPAKGFLSRLCVMKPTSSGGGSSLPSDDGKKDAVKKDS